MEYSCKNSKNEDPIQIYLRDLSMEVKSLGRDLIIFYSSIDSISLIKRAGGIYAIHFTTIEKKSFTISNKFVHTGGYVEDKSAGYSMFVRVLHMHLKEKSKAQLSCRRVFHIPDWQKLLVVGLLFGISYLLDFMGVRLFHPAIHSTALSAIALLLIIVSEKNKAYENFACKDIPKEFLPV